MSDDRTNTPVEPAEQPAPTPVVVAEPRPVAVPAAPVRRRTGAIWWGVLLVIFGGALLASQFAPSVQLWRYWPLIIIAFGVRALFGSSAEPWTIRHLGEGMTTIAFGLVFLGQMLGFLGWDVWLNILRLWPLLLVALGLEIIGKGLHSEWVRLLGSVVIVGGLAYGALVMTTTGGWIFSGMPVGSTEAFDLSAPHDPDVTEGSAMVEGAVGTLTLEAGDMLVTAEGRSPFEPEFEAEAGGSKADVRAGLGSHAWGPFEGRASLDVTLDREVLWDLNVSAGVTEYEVDLRDLNLSDLTFDAGVSDGTLTLGPSDAGDASDPIPISIESGISSLTIRIPEGDDARVVIRGGLVGIDTLGDWSSGREGDDRVYESAGFSDSGAYWEIAIDAGIGGITVEYY